MNAKEKLTLEAVSKHISYDKDTGLFVRIKSSGPSKAGSLVGSKRGGIGVVVGVLGEHVLGHRLAWFMTHGEWPGLVVHKDGNLFNNAIQNLEERHAGIGVPLTSDRLRALLDYCPQSGVFRWKRKTGSQSFGEIAGAKHVSGYVEIGLDGKTYKAHRLAWLYLYGDWPESEVDHINGIRDDNRAANLRHATRAENMQNKKRYASNASGVQGVCFHKATGKWVASIQASKRRRHLGVFCSKEDAGAAYQKAKQDMHKFSPAIRDSAAQLEGA
jgi:hypothetical protein